jgi:hypothetical protein
LKASPGTVTGTSSSNTSSSNTSPVIPETPPPSFLASCALHPMNLRKTPPIHEFQLKHLPTCSHGPNSSGPCSVALENDDQLGCGVCNHNLTLKFPCMDIHFACSVLNTLVPSHAFSVDNPGHHVLLDTITKNLFGGPFAVSNPSLSYFTLLNITHGFLASTSPSCPKDKVCYAFTTLPIVVMAFVKTLIDSELVWYSANNKHDTNGSKSTSRRRCGPSTLFMLGYMIAEVFYSHIVVYPDEIYDSTEENPDWVDPLKKGREAFVKDTSYWPKRVDEVDVEKLIEVIVREDVKWNDASSVDNFFNELSKVDLKVSPPDSVTSPLPSEFLNIHSDLELRLASKDCVERMKYVQKKEALLDPAARKAVTQDVIDKEIYNLVNEDLTFHNPEPVPTKSCYIEPCQELYIKYISLLPSVMRMSDACMKYMYNWMLSTEMEGDYFKRYNEIRKGVLKVGDQGFCMLGYLFEHYSTTVGTPVLGPFLKAFLKCDDKSVDAHMSEIRNLMQLYHDVNDEFLRCPLMPVQRLLDVIQKVKEYMTVWRDVTKSPLFIKYGNGDRFYMKEMLKSSGFVVLCNDLKYAAVMFNSQYRLHTREQSFVKPAIKKYTSIMFPTEQQSSYVRFMHGMNCFSKYCTNILKVILIQLYPSTTSPLPGVPLWLYTALPMKENGVKSFNSLNNFKNCEVWDCGQIVRLLFEQEKVWSMFPNKHCFRDQSGRDQFEDTLVNCRVGAGMVNHSCSTMTVYNILNKLRDISYYVFRNIMKRDGTRLCDLLSKIIIELPKVDDSSSASRGYNDQILSEGYSVDHVHPTYSAHSTSSMYFGGKAKQLSDIQDSLCNVSADKMHFITAVIAPPGYGKSAIAAQIIDKEKSHAHTPRIHVCGVHVCCRQVPLTCTGYSFMRSILDGYDGIRLQEISLECDTEVRQVRSLCRGGPTINPRMSARALARVLCKIKPVKKGDSMLTIVVDGFDEGDDSFVVTFNELVNNLWEMRTRWIRFLITTRMDSKCISDVLMNFPKGYVDVLQFSPHNNALSCDHIYNYEINPANATRPEHFDYHHTDAENDVYDFLKLTPLISYEPFVKLFPDEVYRDTMLKRISKKSEGNMLYASTIYKLLVPEHCISIKYGMDVDKVYEELLVGEKSIFNGPGGAIMLRFYDYYFTNFVENNTGFYSNFVRPIFEIAACAYNPISEVQYYDVLTINEKVNSKEFTCALKLVKPFMDDSSTGMKLNHGELWKWIHINKRPALGVRISEGHRMLANCGKSVSEQFGDPSGTLEFVPTVCLCHYASYLVITRGLDAASKFIDEEWDGKEPLPNMSAEYFNFIRDRIMENPYVMHHYTMMRLFVRTPNIQAKIFLQMLLKMGMSVNMRDGMMGMNVLAFACMREGRGGEEAVEFLLKHKDIEVNIVNNVESAVNALYTCANVGSPGCMNLLLKHPSIDPNAADDQGCNPLHISIVNSHIECVRLILAHPRCNVNLRNKKAETSLYSAAQFGEAEALSLLLERKDAEIHLMHGEEDGTLLHGAAYQCEIDALRVLFADGRIDINTTNKVGISPMVSSALSCATFPTRTKALAMFLKHPDMKMSHVEEVIFRLSGMREHEPFRKSCDKALIMLVQMRDGKPFCCEVCGETKDSMHRALMLCSVCSKVAYCSRDCQMEDWKRHKVNCKKPDEPKVKVKVKGKGKKKR